MKKRSLITAEVCHEAISHFSGPVYRQCEQPAFPRFSAFPATVSECGGPVPEGFSALAMMSEDGIVDFRYALFALDGTEEIG